MKKSKMLLLAATIMSFTAFDSNAMGNKKGLSDNGESCKMEETKCGCEDKNQGCNCGDKHEECGCYECNCDNGKCKSGIFTKMDKNNDGSISKSEATEFHSSRFSMMDKNNDGVLSADEFKAKSCKMGEKECKHHKGMHERMDNAFKTLDKNGDGKISEEEFTNSGEEKRVKMDKNGDGKITEAEFGSARSMSAKKHCGCGK